MANERICGEWRMNEAMTGKSRSDQANFRLLFVCTGNTCRSPMAQAIARRSVERRGWDGVEIRSAGVSALLGGEASEGARGRGRVGRAQPGGTQDHAVGHGVGGLGQPCPDHGTAPRRYR